MTPSQCKMARVGMGLSAKELVEKGQGAFSYPSLANFESGKVSTSQTGRAVEAIQNTLERLGAVWRSDVDQGTIGVDVPQQIDIEQL